MILFQNRWLFWFFCENFWIPGIFFKKICFYIENLSDQPWLAKRETDWCARSKRFCPSWAGPRRGAWWPLVPFSGAEGAKEELPHLRCPRLSWNMQLANRRTTGDYRGTSVAAHAGPDRAISTSSRHDQSRTPTSTYRPHTPCLVRASQHRAARATLFMCEHALGSHGPRTGPDSHDHHRVLPQPRR